MLECLPSHRKFWNNMHVEASSVSDLSDLGFCAGLLCNDCGKAEEPEEWYGRHFWVANEERVVFASGNCILFFLTSFLSEDSDSSYWWSRHLEQNPVLQFTLLAWLTKLWRMYTRPNRTCSFSRFGFLNSTVANFRNRHWLRNVAVSHLSCLLWLLRALDSDRQQWLRDGTGTTNRVHQFF